MYSQEIWDELKAQYELSLMFQEGILGWAKVCDGGQQEAHVYLPTTVELLSKLAVNISDSLAKLSYAVTRIEERGEDQQQKIIVDKLKQYYENLTTIRDQATKLLTMGKQAKKGQEGTFLQKAAQELYEMAETMGVVSVNLKTTLTKMQELEAN